MRWFNGDKYPGEKIREAPVKKKGGGLIGDTKNGRILVEEGRGVITVNTVEKKERKYLSLAVRSTIDLEMKKCRLAR